MRVPTWVFFLFDLATSKRLILDRVNILDIVSPHVRLKRNGRRYVGLCPFHQEKTPSFTVTPDQGFFKCFGCGKGGDVFTFVQLRENMPFADVIRMLADQAGVDLPQATPRAPGETTRADILKANGWAVDWFRANLHNPATGADALKYVHDRGISDEMISRFGIGLVTDQVGSLRPAAEKLGFSPRLLIEADLLRSSESGDRTYDTFRNRLMFPIRDVTSRTIGFGGRTLVDDPAKYLNTRQNVVFDKGRGLYGIDLARDAMAKTGRAILVEGYTDCIAAHQAGFSETVATLGTALTDQQLDLLRRYCDLLIVIFDSDQAGQAAADRAIRLAVPRGLNVRLAQVPQGKDPCDYLLNATSAEFEDVLNRSVNALEFAWQQTQRRLNAQSSDVGRRQAIDDFLNMVADAWSAKAIDNIQKGLLANQVAHLLSVDREEVYRRLAGRKTLNSGSARPSGFGPPKIPRIQGVEHGAWTHILGVLLNEPGLVDVVRSAEVSIPEDSDRVITEVIWDLAERCGDFHLSEVIAVLHEPAQVERAAELARIGAERGNYEATVRIAVERLKLAHRLRRLEESRTHILRRGESTEAHDAGHWTSLQDGLRAGHPFAPPRLRRLNGASSAQTVDGSIETARE